MPDWSGPLTDLLFAVSVSGYIGWLHVRVSRLERAARQKESHEHHDLP